MNTPIVRDDCSLLYNGRTILSKEGRLVYVYDRIGRLVASGYIVDMEALSTGMYLICSGTDRMKIAR